MIVVIRPACEKEDLRIELLERACEVVLVRRVNNELEVEIGRALRKHRELLLLRAGQDDDGVRTERSRLLGRRPVRKDGELGLRAIERQAMNHEAFRSEGACDADPSVLASSNSREIRSPSAMA